MYLNALELYFYEEYIAAISSQKSKEIVFLSINYIYKVKYFKERAIIYNSILFIY